jgi:hypothetical protein
MLRRFRGWDVKTTGDGEHQLKGLPGSRKPFAVIHHDPGTNVSGPTHGAQEDDLRAMTMSSGSVFGAPTAQPVQTIGRGSSTEFRLRGRL